MRYAAGRPLSYHARLDREGRHLQGTEQVRHSVKQGDRIFFRKYAGNEVTIDAVEHVILREEEILGVYQA